MNGSRIRYAGAGCLIAVGVMVGCPAGVALAEPAAGHHGVDGNQVYHHGGLTRAGLAGPPGFGGQGFGSSKRGPGQGPRSRVGDGREGIAGGNPDRYSSSTTNRAARPGPNRAPPKGAAAGNGNTDGTGSGGTDPAKPVDAAGMRTAGGWFSLPTNWPFAFPIPFLGIFTGQGHTSTSYNGTNYFQAWQQTFQQFVQAIVPPPPPPQPQTRAQVEQPEPVLNATPGGRGEGTEPRPGNLPEPPVLRAPVVVPLGAPVAVPPVAVAAPPVALPPRSPLPGLPSSALAVPPARTPPPKIGNSVPPVRGVGTPMSSRASYRVGYTDYLRSARMPQLATAALPGVAGMLLLTASGGFIGYRQAKAGLSVRTRSADRFLG